MSDHPVTDAVVAAPQEVGYKTFVGNLAFSTTDEDLKEIFGSVGEISNAQVINRGARSLGYGFVTFSTEADAIKAVSQLDKSELAGRQINVELAKPPTATAAGRIPKAAAKAAIQQGATEGEEVTEGQGEAKAKKSKSKKRAPKGRRPRADAETEEAGDAPASSEGVTAQLAATNLNADGSAAAPSSAPKKRNARRGPKAAAVNEDGTPVAASTPAPRRGPPTGEPSKTLLFVANLPFSVTDDALAKVFEGYKLASARVVTKKFGPSEGKSKGFGFVDFESEEEQQKALNGCQGKEVEGREIQLKVAIQEEKREKKQEEEKPSAEANGVAPAPVAPKAEESLKEAEATIVAS